MLTLQVNRKGTPKVYAHYREPNAGPNNGGCVASIYPGGRFLGLTFEQLRALGSGVHQVEVPDERDMSSTGEEPTYKSERERQYEVFCFALFGHCVGLYTELEVLTFAERAIEAGKAR
jgi:hypothetical protein